MNNQQHQYDSDQQRVIELKEGHWLVLAPPGCGKTDILAARVQNALTEGVDPQQMVCLTFTNRASRGMRERIDLMLGKEQGEKVFTGNLHCLCSNLLYSCRMVHHSTSVIDEQDSNDLILDYMSERKLQNSRSVSFAKDCYRLQHLFWQMSHHHPKELQTDREMLSGRMVSELCQQWDRPCTLEGFLDIYHNASTLIDDPKAQTLDTNNELLQQLAVAYWYECYKKKYRLLDFADLLILTYEALVNKPERMPRYGWIQIDEVQDLNRLQLAIIDLLTDNDNPSMVLYLGDEQQAIFAFMGAKLQTLEWIKERCDNKILHLTTNYRSPSYLQQVFNTYAAQQLKTDPDFLPTPSRIEQQKPGDMVIHYAFSERSACYDVAQMVSQYPSSQRTAILVSSNAEADMIGNAFDDAMLPYFKISGVDFFSTPEMQLLISHLKVIHSESDTVAWARLLHRLQVTRSFSDGRRIMEQLAPQALLPSDLLEEKPYSLRFAESMRGDVVVFDTETTGLDVTSDDIVQIAAFRIHNGVYSGKPEDTLNLIMRTDKQLPLTLGLIDNPLIEPYRKAEADGTLVEASVGLQQFLDFCEGLPLVGHNVEYDYRILQFNLIRRCQRYDLEQIHPIYFDTLKIARLIYPQMSSHKLKDLIAELQLEGENSHMADDDALATVRLAFHLAEKAEALELSQQALLDDMKRERTELRRSYETLYRDTCSMRYINPFASEERVGEGDPVLLEAINRSYHLMQNSNRYKPIDKLPYLLYYIRHYFEHHTMPNTLLQQLDLFMPILSTLRESDLVGSDMGAKLEGQQVVISTIHKAKGLEFENVIVFNVVEGRYPFYLNSRMLNKASHDEEDARKLYVALTRSRQRLILVIPKHQLCRSKMGESYLKQYAPSPFINAIASYFDKEESSNDHYEEQQFIHQSSATCWRFEVTRIENKQIFGLADQEGSRELQLECYNNNPYGDWTYIKRLLRIGSVVNLVQPHLQGTIVWADLYIYEPDYLVSATEISRCINDFGDSSMLHLLNKLQSTEPNPHLLLGNLVGKFLDDEIFHRDIPYEESHADFFSRNKIDYTLSVDDPNFNADDFEANAKHQRSNIHTIFTKLMPAIEGFDIEQSILEPSFLCQMLGIEGRMDFLQSDFSILLEQKSGKYDNYGGIRSRLEHKVQLLLYRAILHFNYNIPSEKIASHMLYTRYDDGLLREYPDAAILFRAFGVRNVLVRRLINHMEPQGLDFLDTLSPDQLPKREGVFYTNYFLPPIKAVLDPIQQASELERAYFKRFLQFAMREDWIEQMGTPNSNEYGQSALWRLTASEKRNAGKLIDNLILLSTLDDKGNPVEQGEAVSRLLFKLPESYVATNLRRNDRISLYAYHPYTDNKEFGERRRDQICRSIVFIGSVISIGQQLEIALAADQSNQLLFRPSKDQRWAVEPYRTRSSKSSAYESLLAFLTTDAHRRGWILGTESPRKHTAVTLHYNYSDPLHKALATRAMEAEDYFLVMGPPGTGKTSVALMNILREELCKPQASVLLCAFTNQAVDEICHKLMASPDAIDFVRVGSPTAVGESVRPYLLDERLRDCKTPQQVSDTIASIPIIVSTVSAMSNGNIFSMKHFSLAIVDEASQLLETQMLPILTARNDRGMAIDRFVFIGDHKQLASIVGESRDELLIHEEILNQHGFTDCRHSLFERLYRRHLAEGEESSFAIMLKKQGRMHVDIADFPNRYFYGSHLEPMDEKRQRALLKPIEGSEGKLSALLDSHRFLFFDMQPQTLSYISSNNVNTDEALLIAQLAKELYLRIGPKQFNPDTSIGIIVPYRMQISAVREAILQLESFPESDRQQLAAITIDTVERYQGSQRKAIIYGFTVKEPQQLKFLCDNTFDDPENGKTIDRKLNVAMTRAQEHLIMIGNADLLSYNPLFNQLIVYAKKHNSFIQ